MTKSITEAQGTALSQRSHTLLVFSNAPKVEKKNYEVWLKSDAWTEFSHNKKVLSVKSYRQHPMDFGGYEPIGFNYLTLVQLSLNGAEDVVSVLDKLHTIFNEVSGSQSVATWLYYPVSEKVGLRRNTDAPYLTIAFANAVEGMEAEFREWYSSQHIRHALIIPALVSGQCFELTAYQASVGVESCYQTIAIYEQDSTPQEMIDSFLNIEPEELKWSRSGDLKRFTEWAYEAI